MNMKRIRQLKNFFLLFLLIHAFSWFAVPIHLQNSSQCSELDACNEQGERASNSSIYASHFKFQGSKAVPKLHKLLKHDESHCPICSLAQSKILPDSTESQADFYAVDWLHLIGEKVKSFFLPFRESIRAPPLTSLLS